MFGLNRKFPIQTITRSDANYPPLLREIHDAPKELFVRGSVEALSEKHCIAVVGTRKISPYGKQVLNAIIPPLCRAEATIVSGLAFGVDGFSHEVALHHGGKCVAVFGCGIDIIYPPQHRVLADRILETGGALVSEYPAGTTPYPANFPQRNRIISGLSKSVLIIEAKKRSGSLITASLALEQNREVYAVPGNIFTENQEGTNSLIADGAHPIISAERLLLELGLKSAESPESLNIVFDSEEQKMIYEHLQEPRTVDHLISRTQFAPSLVSQTLTLLELKGIVKNYGGGQYGRF